MIIDKILQGLKTSEQRITTVINDTCLGFQEAEKEFIEKLLKNVAEEIDRFNSPKDTINVIGRSGIGVEVRFGNWPEWERYYRYIYTTGDSNNRKLNSFIRKSVLKYGFPEDRSFSCNAAHGLFSVTLYSFGNTCLGEDNSNYDVK